MTLEQPIADSRRAICIFFFFFLKNRQANSVIFVVVFLNYARFTLKYNAYNLIWSFKKIQMKLF